MLLQYSWNIAILLNNLCYTLIKKFPELPPDDALSQLIWILFFWLGCHIYHWHFPSNFITIAWFVKVTPSWVLPLHIFSIFYSFKNGVEVATTSEFLTKNETNTIQQPSNSPDGSLQFFSVRASQKITGNAF